MAAMRLSSALGAVAAAAAVVAALAAASAHVAPAIGDNNRYLKLTLLADRVRLAYTVFYGEQPGAELRRTLDTNRDGSLDDRETEAFGAELARDVAGAVAVTLDGVPARVAWSQVVVGLGTPRVAAGAFSVDLVAWLCLASPRGKHAVLLRDSYPLARPGETEVKVEDSPGVAIHATRIGGAVDDAHAYTLVGPSGALDTEGLDLQFTAGDSAPIPRDAACRRAAAHSTPVAVIVASAVVGAVVTGAGVALLVLGLRRRRASSAVDPVRRSRR